MGRQINIKQCNLERTFKKGLRNIPSQVVTRAIAIAKDISFNKVNPSIYDGKRLNINRKVISVKVRRHYRLLMTETDKGIMPWQCLSHEKYNKLYMRIHS